MKEHGIDFAIDKAYELTIKQEIIDSIIYDRTLSEKEIEILLKCDNVLDQCYDEWLKSDGNIRDTLNFVVDERVDFIIDDYSKLPFTTQGEGDEDFAKATKLANKWSEEFSNLDPNNTTKLNFNSYYDQFVFDIGSDGQMYYNLAVNESDATSALDDKRQQVTGVSTDEELTYMIKYQQAYNASSRYVTVISEMLEHIINRLGA